MNDMHNQNAKLQKATHTLSDLRIRFLRPLHEKLMSTGPNYDILNRGNASRWFKVVLRSVEDGKHGRMREGLRNLQLIVLKRGRNSEEALHYLLVMGTVEKNGSAAAGMLRDECEDVLAHSLGVLNLLDSGQNTAMRIANAAVYGLPPEKKVDALIEALSELLVNSVKTTQTDDEKIGNLLLIKSYRKKLESSLAKLPKSKFPELRQKALETIGAVDSRVADLRADIENAKHAMQVNADV